jgi:hypothetical protein
MEIGNHKIWQVAAGDTNRNYADVCLEWDVILNGPGSKEKWPECRDAVAKYCSPRKLTDIKRFAEDIIDGDIIVLRLGTTDVLGVGVAVGNYQWNEEFGDIDGWDLQHIRRVRWIWKYNDIGQKGTQPKFDVYSLKLGDTTQKMDSQPVIDWITALPVSAQMLRRDIMTLPKYSHDIAINDISEHLFDKGVAAGSIASVTGEIDELVRIAEWYQRKDIRPSEAETIAYLVIPLLRGLGWTPQKMAVEWNRVDVALFKTLPRGNEKLSVVVEAKPKDSSCLNATSQALYYAQQPGRDICNRLIVTDGIRYGVYAKVDGEFLEHPDAYLNITRMREAYPILKCCGAKEAFLYMSSDWN